MRNRIKQMFIDRFFRNVLVLASGSMFSQVLILVTLPVVTRLYSPVDFGIFAVYASIISIILMLTSLAYENAVPLPNEDRTASSIVHLSLLICLIVSVISGSLFYGLHAEIAVWLHEPDMQEYSWIFTASLFGAGCYQVLNYWSIRKEYFKQLSRTKYVSSICQVVSQLGLGVLSGGPFGLLIGDLLGKVSGGWSQWRLWRKDVNREKMHSNWKEMKENAYRYRRFPLLSSGSNLLNSLSLYLPNILLAILYGPYIAGLFTLAQRILGAPTALVSFSVGQVYLSEFAICANNSPDKIFPLFMATLRKAVVGGLVIIGGVVVFGPILIHNFFSQEWGAAAQFLVILSVMYFSLFVANCVGATIDVMERQDLHLYRELVRIVLIVGALYLAKMTHQSAEMAIVILSIAATIGYILHLGLSFHSVMRYKRAAEENVQGTLAANPD